MGSQISCRIRFTETATEERVREGQDGKPDTNYTVTHSRGKEMDCTQATAKHWISRGKAEIVEGGPRDQPAVSSGMSSMLPPPPAA